MDRDTVIKLAREAGGVFDGGNWRLNAEFDKNDLYRFAALVAAAEREACAKVCGAASEPRKGYGQTDEQWAASTLAERIRARSQQ